MKKLAILLVFSLFGCLENPNKRGEILDAPQDFIIIHGKTYKLMSVRADNEGHYVWIMYPKDSTDSVPQTINYTSGKTNQTIIKVD